jgi:hypothetical protein
VSSSQPFDLWRCWAAWLSTAVDSVSDSAPYCAATRFASSRRAAPTPDLRAAKISEEVLFVWASSILARFDRETGCGHWKRELGRLAHVRSATRPVGRRNGVSSSR